MKKPSFLDRLTGGGHGDDYDRILDENHQFGQDDDLAIKEDTYQEEEEEESFIFLTRSLGFARDDIQIICSIKS